MNIGSMNRRIGDLPYKTIKDVEPIRDNKPLQKVRDDMYGKMTPDPLRQGNYDSRQQRDLDKPLGYVGPKMNSRTVDLNQRSEELKSAYVSEGRDSGDREYGLAA